MKVVVMGREFVSELLGTMVLIMFGCGSVAQSVIVKNNLKNDRLRDDGTIRSV